MSKQKKAFTLVELIVVITILAILGTIAFISMQGYSLSSRDSVRLSDIGKIETSLELFQINSGKYPNTTNGTEITYSGSNAWIQGNFGESTYINIERLNKIPKDPLTGLEYIYSLTNTKQEYQIAGIMESTDFFGMNILEVKAANETIGLKITGNYNGQILKVFKGNDIFILAMPSIITSSGTTLENIVVKKLLAYDGYKNLPFNYNTSKYKILGESTDNGITSDLELVKATNIEIYYGKIAELTKQEKQIDFVKNLQKAYKSTRIENNNEIKVILNYDTIGNTEGTKFIAQTIINKNITKTVNITAENKPNVLIPKNVLYCGTLTGQILYGTLDGTDTGLTCGDDIIICNGTTGSGYTIKSCNVGTSNLMAFHNDTSSYGELFQWGNNAGLRTETNTGNIKIDTSATGSTYNSPIFIELSSWQNLNKDLWGDISGTDSARIGPCEIGYHVPSNNEWLGLYAAGGWLDTERGNMSNILKLPLSGGRSHNTSNLYSQGSQGFYWSSTPGGSSGYLMNVSLNDSTPNYYTYGSQGYGLSVRCFKNK